MNSVVFSLSVNIQLDTEGGRGGGELGRGKGARGSFRFGKNYRFKKRPTRLELLENE